MRALSAFGWACSRSATRCRACWNRSIATASFARNEASGSSVVATATGIGSVAIGLDPAHVSPDVRVPLGETAQFVIHGETTVTCASPRHATEGSGTASGAGLWPGHWQTQIAAILAVT